MWKALLWMAVLASAPALAQVDAGASTHAGGAAPDVDELRKEIDKDVQKKVDAAKKEMEGEMRAQLASRSAAQGWQEEWVEQNRKLDLFELSGYYRARPDLFNKFDLGRFPDPDGYQLWPTGSCSTCNPPYSLRERTQSGANMRLRLEPTLNISEEVRIKMQADVLDNLVFGSTPDYAFAMQQRNQFGIFSMSQNAPIAGLNSSVNSIDIKRVWGEVSTPVGILRFGRMGSHWGLGMLHNDGNCLDCDNGETVDRVMFVAEPITGYYVTPMFDMNIAGLTTQQTAHPTNAPEEISSTDDAKSFVIAAARRDTDQQAKAKLENNLAVFNYGVHFTYRWQHNDVVDFYNRPYGSFPSASTTGIPNDGNVNNSLNSGFVTRNAQLYMPDVWVKYERKLFRIEAEVAAIIGNIGNRALTGSFCGPGGTACPNSANSGDVGNNPLGLTNQSLSVTQFGGVLQSEVKLMDGNLRIGLELGFATGDKAPGFGNFPNRVLKQPYTVPGDIDGPQYQCTTSICQDSSINNFRFAQDYRVDNILFRELLGGITDTAYAKPNASYQVADGLHIFASVIGSTAIYKSSTPSTISSLLGIEVNAGARYETEDGFFAQLTWALLVPLDGLQNFPAVTGASLDNAQALRGIAGIKF